jgi:two-component system chemotaxis response regulator CheY
MTRLPMGGAYLTSPRIMASTSGKRNGLRPLTALIVDDNRHMRKLLRTLLAAYGVPNIFDARDGGTGIEAVNSIAPDFILTDYDMRPMNGVAFVKAVRRTCPPPLAWVPIVMITAHTEQGRIQIARDAGITEALCKPVTPQNLFDRIVQIIERPRQFVAAPDFAGPDRRRRKSADHAGPHRRSEDGRSGTEIVEI